MSTGPGSVCTITPYAILATELQPEDGDFLRTRAGSCYRIEHVHALPGRPGVRRYRLRCTRLEREAVELGEPGVFSLTWDPR